MWIIEYISFLILKNRIGITRSCLPFNKSKWIEMNIKRKIAKLSEHANLKISINIGDLLVIKWHQAAMYSNVRGGIRVYEEKKCYRYAKYWNITSKIIRNFLSSWIIPYNPIFNIRDASFFYITADSILTQFLFQCSSGVEDDSRIKI